MPTLARPLSAALLAAATLFATAALSGCGKSSTLSQGSSEASHTTAAPDASGTASLSTVNTTRIGGSSAAVDAAAVARAVYPGVAGEGRPQAVVLVDSSNWSAALAASVLEGPPLHAPLLYSEGIVLPSVTAAAIEALLPTGDPSFGRAQAIRVGESTAAPAELRVTSLTGSEPAALAVEVERLQSELSGHPPRSVIVTASDAPPALSEPAAGLSALTAAPILFVSHSQIPSPTRSELKRLGHVSIYVVGPTAAVSEALLAQLGRYGTVTRISGPTPASNAVAVARFSNGSFGWGAREAGHGFAFAQASRPLDGPAAAALASNGDFAPLLLLEAQDSIPSPVSEYVSDLQPGYPATGPVHGVYNHGWLIGDQHTTSAAVQVKLDAMLAITNHRPSSEPAAPELEGQ